MEDVFYKQMLEAYRDANKIRRALNEELFISGTVESIAVPLFQARLMLRVEKDIQEVK